MGKGTERILRNDGNRRGRGLNDADFLWMGLAIISMVVNAYVIYGLKQPVYQPPVVVQKNDSYEARFHEAQEAWKEDQVQIKALKRKLRDYESGTTYVP